MTKDNKLESLLPPSDQKVKNERPFLTSYIHGFGSVMCYTGLVGIADLLFASGLDVYRMHPFGDLAIGSGALMGRITKSNYNEVPVARFGESAASATVFAVSLMPASLAWVASPEAGLLTVVLGL